MIIGTPPVEVLVFDADPADPVPEALVAVDFADPEVLVWVEVSELLKKLSQYFFWLIMSGED